MHKNIAICFHLGYYDLFDNGLKGDEVGERANDILAYFDSALHSKGAEQMLIELVEAMPKDKRVFLLKLLNERLS